MSRMSRMSRWQTSSAALLLLPSLLTGAARRPQDSGPDPRPLAEPWVARRADGIERSNRELGAAESYLTILYPSSHAANLLELSNGDVLCVWFSGTWEGDSGVGIVLSRRPRGSRRWSPTTLIDRQPGYSYQNPVLFEDSGGVLHLYHSRQGAGAGEAGAQVLHLVSRDGGVTWSRPELAFPRPGAFSRHPLVLRGDGAWLLPLSYITGASPGANGQTGSENYSVTEISRDRGRSWQECTMANTRGRLQPTIVSPAPGRLLSFFRSRAGDLIFSSTSADGCSWTPAEPTALPNNDASVQAVRLRSGHLAMAFDNSSRGPGGGGGLRKPLSVALSEDGGRSWPAVRDIETGRPGYGAAEQRPREPGREEYSYPSILETRGGEILVAFTFRRQTIKVVSFDEGWIRRGGTVGQFRGAR